MKRVVYVLGAGFSAPLGLPVISSFLDRAKDQYLKDPVVNKHFHEVFRAIREIATCKRYTSLDLENIEEILSLVEMSESVGGTATKPDYERFIRDVITYYTPGVSSGELGRDWVENTFGAAPWAPYGAFVAALNRVGLRLVPSVPVTEGTAYELADIDHAETRYSIITLNYDLALERAGQIVNERLRANVEFQRPTAREQLSDDALAIPLVKLHGSVDRGPIVPPTWSKGLRDEDVRAQWKAAYRLLRDAQDIRIMGYSLPANDAYVRFLVRTALMDSVVLQKIDVLCVDDATGRVEARYRDFFSYGKLVFRNLRIEQYLESVTHARWPWVEEFGSRDLERAHEAMFFIPPL